ncbi:ribosome biosynthesis protein rrb1 [Nowakowskiella sp. JEL0078]|nr:ribosome biosynthesis protein rrb1 [Nowakowskiella sp. JEL0078]
MSSETAPSQRNLKSTKTSEISQTNFTPFDSEEAVGEFEDAWEDERDDEGEVVISPDSDEEDGEMEVDDEEEEVQDEVKVYLPDQILQDGEELVADQSAYDMLHSLTVEWPCLSFDILRDPLGSSRSIFPHTAYVVAGSQAERPKDNRMYVMKMSQLHKTKHDNGDDEDEDDNADDLDDDPELDYKAIPHFGGVNRIRAMPHTDSQIVASWAETGKVHIWDLTPFVTALDTIGGQTPKDPKPIFTVDRHHKTEGYGLDWSPISPGRLLSGDNAQKIYLTQYASSGEFVTESQPFIGHSSSVEDIQWSPGEENVFVSAGADGFIKVWDLRTKKEAMLGIQAHDCDVNVISWHRLVMVPRLSNAAKTPHRRK